MIAMALGNLYGGRTADKNPNPDRLYARILFASVWIAAIPVVGKYIILGISGLLIFTVSSNFLIIAGFAACMVIFVFPLFLLGTTTPSLAKYSLESLDEGGRIVGRLNAANTIGSIIGTFVPTFISIPAVGTSITFLIFAGILLALALIYFISSKIPWKKAKKVPISAALFILCCIFGHNSSFAFWRDDLKYEGESVYNYLQVYDDAEKTVFSTNVLFGVQSVYMKSKSLTGLYYDYAMAAPFMARTVEKGGADILVLGNGTGTFATQCLRYFPGVRAEGVEIDGSITELAEEYFELPEEVNVTTYDGRAYLQALDSKYDVIMVDAYQDITIPFQMASLEFFELVRDHLNEGGVMVVNMSMRGNGEGSLNEYLADTIAHVFPEVCTVDVTGSTNRELFAGMDGALMTAFDSDLARTDDAALAEMMHTVREHIVPYEPGSYCMTDDMAPVELLSMQMIDAIIQDEAAYYRRIYDEEGLSGLLDRL